MKNVSPNFDVISDLHKRNYKRQINVNIVKTFIFSITLSFFELEPWFFVNKLMYNIFKIHQKTQITSEVTAHYSYSFVWITLFNHVIDHFFRKICYFSKIPFPFSSLWSRHKIENFFDDPEGRGGHAHFFPKIFNWLPFNTFPLVPWFLITCRP